MAAMQWRHLLLLISLAGCSQTEAPQTQPVESAQRAGANAQLCGLQEVSYRFRDFQDKFLVGNAAPGPAARKAVFAKRRIRVNTDGAAASYHSEDLAADNAAIGALNSICNAGVEIHKRGWFDFIWPGERVKCAAGPAAVNPSYAQAFSAIRQNDWRPTDLYNIHFNWNILAKDEPGSRISRLLEPEKPCIQEGGFFVSKTKAKHREPARSCDQQAYFDSAAISAFVLPQHWFADWDSSRVQRWGSFGPGDVVVAYRPASKPEDQDNWVYGVVGDAGPVNQLGEATLDFNWKLLGKVGDLRESIRTYRDAMKLDTGPEKMAFLVLEGSGVAFGNNFTDARIDAIGNRIFEDWGGKKRFLECANKL